MSDALYINLDLTRNSDTSNVYVYITSEIHPYRHKAGIPKHREITAARRRGCKIGIYWSTTEEIQD